MNCFTKSSYIVSGIPCNSQSSAVTSSLFFSFSRSIAFCLSYFLVNFGGFDKLISFRGRPFFLMGFSSPVAAAIANLVFFVNLSYLFRLPSLGPLVSLSTLNLTSPSSYFFIFVGCILRLNCCGVAADYLSFTYEEGDMFALSGVRPGFDTPLESVKDPFYF